MRSIESSTFPGAARDGVDAATMGAIATARGDARRRRGGAQATRWRRRSSARGGGGECVVVGAENHETDERDERVDAD